LILFQSYDTASVEYILYSFNRFACNAIVFIINFCLSCREEIEKQKAHERYMKLQEQGKTEQAKNRKRLKLPNDLPGEKKLCCPRKYMLSVRLASTFIMNIIIPCLQLSKQLFLFSQFAGHVVSYRVS